MRRPEVFLLDEPLSNLDQKLRMHLREEIRNIQRSLKATMLLVTHDQTEAASLGDRIALMNEGRIEQVGRPMDLYGLPDNTFVAEFMAYPQMNLIRGFLTSRKDEIFFQERGSGSISFRLSGLQTNLFGDRFRDGIIAGVRPESVSVIRFCKDPTHHDNHGWAQALNVVPCGSFSYLHMDTGSHKLIGTVDSHACIGTGKRVKIFIDLSKAVFFDPLSGKRIHP
jgi:multiple sugar transport system ATP-binding protein